MPGGNLVEYIGANPGVNRLCLVGFPLAVLDSTLSPLLVNSSRLRLEVHARYGYRSRKPHAGKYIQKRIPPTY